MALVTWSKDYSVGVASIDKQHTVLFGLLNDLHAAMMNRQTQQTVGTILRRLLKYTHEHFAAEEAMMEAAKYPGLTRHRAIHRDLTRQVEEFVARFERGEGTVNIQLLTFLRDWLTQHIQRTDKEYSSCLVKHGAH